MRSKVLILIYLLSVIMPLGAQGLLRYPLNIYSVDDGLSQSSVYHIIQDSRSYIWAGSGDGLNRLSPQHIKVFKQHLNDNNSLWANSIRGLLEDKNGNIWIGTDKGLNVYLQSENLLLRNYKGRDLGAISTAVPIGVWMDKLIYLEQNKGFWSLDLRNGKRELFLPTTRLFRSDSRCMAIKDNKLWAATFDGKIFYMDLLSCISGVLEIPEPSAGVFQLAFSGERLLIANGSSLFYLLEESWMNLFTTEETIQAFLPLRSGDIWVAEWGKGVWRLNSRGEVTEKVRNRLKWPGKEAVDISMVNTLRESKEGMVWMGVEGLGIISLETTGSFELITADDPYWPGLENPFIRSVLPIDSHTFLCGTYRGGLYEVNIPEKKVSRINWPSEYGLIFNSLSRRGDSVFVGTEAGTFLYHRRAFSIEKLNGHAPKSMLSLKNCILLACEKGLYRYHFSGTETEKLDGGNFRFICAKEDGFIAITTADIVVGNYLGEIIKRGGDKWKEYQMKSILPYQGVYWVSSEHGLLPIDPNTFDLMPLNWSTTHLPDYLVYGMQSQGDFLWGSTNKGIFRINLKNGYLFSYKVQDGLQSNEFNSGCFAKMDDGTIIFGGINGLNLIRKSVNKDTIPPLYLRQVWLNDEKSSGDYLRSGLKSYERSFSFEWDLMQWKNKPGVKAYYRLMGIENNWKELNPHQILRYNALPAGTYKLVAKIINDRGHSGREIEFASFTIPQPLFKRSWFIWFATVLGSIMLLGGMYFIQNYRYRQRLMVLERQKEMDQLRKRISRDIHDDVGSDLSKIRMLSQQISLNPVNTDEIQQKLISLSDKAMSGLSEVVWTVNSTYDRLEDMVAWFRSYAYEYFENSDLNISFESSGETYLLLVDPDVRRNLLMIYKEALNNILKHASATEIKVCWMNDSAGVFQLKICDNGKGMIVNARSSRGNGLKNMEMRALQSGFELQIHSAVNEGCCTEVRGKLSQGKY